MDKVSVNIDLMMVYHKVSLGTFTFNVYISPLSNGDVLAAWQAHVGLNEPHIVHMGQIESPVRAQ